MCETIGLAGDESPPAAVWFAYTPDRKDEHPKVRNPIAKPIRIPGRFRSLFQGPSPSLVGERSES